jgi:hypothetical protein
MYRPAGATPCTCPSLGRPLDLPNLPQPDEIIANTATAVNNLFFIVFNFEGKDKSNIYLKKIFDLISLD